MCSLWLNFTFFSLQGSLEIFTGLGLILGPPLGGWFYQAFGYEVPFLILGCLLMLMVPFNIYVLPSIGSVWDCRRVCPSTWRGKIILSPLFSCFDLRRGNVLQGFLPPSSHQAESRPHLLRHLHSQCRTGLLGCHVVTVCYRYGNHVSKLSRPPVHLCLFNDLLFIPPHQFKLSPGSVGLIMLGLSLPYCLASPVLGFITDKYPVSLIVNPSFFFILFLF